MTPDNDNLGPYIWDGIKWTLSGVGVIAIGLWKSMRRKHNTRFARIEERVEDLDRRVITAPIEYVSRETFQRHERDTRDAIAELRAAGDGRELRIVASIKESENRIHARIDELFSNRSGGK